MLRTVGLCVIVISGVGCGFAMSNELGRRKKMMEMILRMIILLRGEIRYGNKSLYDAFTGASGKLEGKYREFFILTAQKMKEKTAFHFQTEHVGQMKSIKHNHLLPVLEVHRQ